MSPLDVATSAHQPKTKLNRDPENVQCCQKERLDFVLNFAPGMTPVPADRSAAAMVVDTLARLLFQTRKPSLAVWMTDEPWPPSIIVPTCHLYLKSWAFPGTPPLPGTPGSWGEVLE